jgi:formamidopyrimidine-DNA glycosylase
VPELPEVEALALDLGGRLAGHAIQTVHIATFSALKTFDPPLRALEGGLVEGVTRHGKFLDISVSGLHLVMHLARGGWVRWKDEVPTLPPKPSGRNPLAARVVLEDMSGLDITEAGTKKRLAIYVVRDPQDVPGIASLGPDPLTDDFTLERLRGILEAEGRKQLKGVLRHQGTIAGIGNAYSDEILHAARMSPFKPAATLIEGDDDSELVVLYDAIRVTLGDAVDRSRGLAASELKSEKKSNLAVHGRTGEACPGACSTAPPARPAASPSPTGG